MSGPKTFKRFTAYWMDLFDSFKASPHKPFEVECKDTKKAFALRLEFYKAREAVLLDPDWTGEYEEALNAREARVDGTKVIFDTKDNNAIGQLLKAALEKDGAPMLDGKDKEA